MLSDGLYSLGTKKTGTDFVLTVPGLWVMGWSRLEIQEGISFESQYYGYIVNDMASGLS